MKVDIYNTDKKYTIIYADPPWEYKQKQINFQQYDRGKKYINSVNDHYNTMTKYELINMRDTIQKISEKDCLLFMGATGSNLDVAVDLGREWGFDFKTVAFVWDKQRTNYGFYTLSQCELCLVFKKGKIPKKQVNNVKQFLSEHVGKHSKKPEKIRYRIDLMFSNQKRIELFAREEAEGWDCWGNEV
jgi:N6-adenosine-specific RNA methylase IME4